MNDGLKSRDNIKRFFLLMFVFIKKIRTIIPTKIEIKIVANQISPLNFSILERGPNPIFTGPSYPTPPSRQLIKCPDN